MCGIRILIVLIMITGVQNVHAEVYKWVDENGRTHYSDKPHPTEENEIQNDIQTNVAGKNTGKKNTANRDVNQKSITYQPSITLKVRKMLRKKQFHRLNQLLENYQTAFDASPLAEEKLFIAYNAFDTRHPSYLPLINAWIKAKPNNYQPYLARAIFNEGLGWKSRGGKYAPKTTEEQFSEMWVYFKKASDDIAKVFSINDRTIVPYRLLISIAKHKKNTGKEQYYLQQALQKNMTSYQLRATYIESLFPRWGGSIKQMQDFANKSLNVLQKNSKLKLLQGYIPFEKARYFSSEKMYGKAEKLYTQALSFGIHHIFLYHRAKNRYRQGNYNAALKDFHQAISLFPENSDYYYWRSKTFAELNSHLNASMDIEQAILFEPDKQSVYAFKRRLSTFTDAKEQFEEFEQFNSDTLKQINREIWTSPEEATLYLERAQIFMNQNDHASALTDIKRAIEIDPKGYIYYEALDQILIRRRDFEQIIDNWKQYIELVPDDSRAYHEISGTYFHQGDIESALKNAKIAAEMGNLGAQRDYEKMKNKVP